MDKIRLIKKVNVYDLYSVHGVTKNYMKDFLIKKLSKLKPLR